MRYLSFLFILFTCFSCSKDELFGDQVRHDLWLLHNGADIPIVVEGNTNSEVFVILLHGGPGGSSQDFNAGSKPFTDVLEKDYAMVYYDQRNAGLARGVWDEDKLTIGQHVEDLDKVIELILSRYGLDVKILLAGHSWGGYLGTAYVLGKSRADKLKAFINIDGLTHRNLRNLHSLDKISEIGEAQIADGKNVEKWTNLLQEVQTERNKNITQYDLESEDPVFRLNRLAVPIMDEDNLIEYNSSSERSSVFRDNYDPFLILANDRKGTLIEQMYDFDATIDAALSEVTVPILSLYGKYDTNTPVQQGIYLHSKIGTDEADQKLIILNNSGHSSPNNEPILLAEEMKNWIELYR